MKKIGLIGGTFDPIHFGHLILAEQARVEEGLDQVVFMPAKTSPYKVCKKCAEEDHRYKMVVLATKSNPHFTVSDLELKGPSISYTIDTLRACQDIFGPNHQLYFICGTDAFIGMEGWKNKESLLSDFPLIVGSRPRYRDKARDDMIEKVEREYGARVHKVHMPRIDISSTDIKDKIANKRSIRYMLPEAVMDYIEDMGLYRNL